MWEPTGGSQDRQSGSCQLDIYKYCRQYCFGTSEWSAVKLTGGFVSLIRLSDRIIYHLEDA